jgi:succinoglycan biosynthesis transport protein ExoP
MISAPSPKIAPGNAAAPVPSFTAARDSQSGFDLRRVWHTLREKLWLLVLCVIAGLLLAGVYLFRAPKLYQSHLGLEVEFQDPAGVPGDEGAARMRSAFLLTQESLRTIEQSLTSPTLLARVVRAEGLASDGGVALLGRSIVEGEESTRRKDRRSRGAAASDVATTYTPVEQALADALTQMVKTGIRRGTRLIDVFVTTRDPAISQRVAEAIGREYIRSATERRSGSNQETLRYLMEEEERLKQNLQKSEAAVAEYKAKTPDALQLGGGAASTGSQAGAGSTITRGGLVEDKLQELSTRLSTARADRMRLERELTQIEEAGENVDALLAVPSIAASPSVTERRRDLAQIEATVATLAQRYKEKHPKMMAARAALVEARRAVQQAAIAQPAVLRNAFEQAQAAEKTAEAAMQEQEKAALALNKASIGYQELARQAESDRALYESVLRQIKATDFSKGVKTNPVTVTEHASPPVSVGARPLKAIALGLLVGIAAGLGVIFGLDALDRSLKTVDQTEATLGLPVLAAIPESKERGDSDSGDGRNGTAESVRYRLVAEAPEGPAAEAFRNLRATLGLLGREAERRVYLFTSAAPGEGKSFTSANYALSLAQEGHRVLLIDGDLRRPNLHRIFQEIGPGESLVPQRADDPGVVDCLVGRIDLSKAARRVTLGPHEHFSTGVESDEQSGRSGPGQLWVLVGGRRAPNPAELLSGGAFAELAAAAASSFDRVVVDSAPILAVSDTLLMAPRVHTICLVVRAGNTPRNAVQRAIALLATAGSRPAGIILTRLRPHGSGDYYYDYSNPGYGAAGGVYGDSYRRTESKPRRTRNNQPA